MFRTRFSWILPLACLTLAFAVALPSMAAPKKDKKKDPFTHFGELTEDTEHLTGFFEVYKKRDDVFLEIPLEQLGQDFLLIETLSRGIGTHGFLGGMPLNFFEAATLRFERKGDRVFLYQRNDHFTADAGTAMARAVDKSYGQTVLATFPIKSERREGDEVGVVPEPPEEKKDKKKGEDAKDDEPKDDDSGDDSDEAEDGDDGDEKDGEASEGDDSESTDDEDNDSEEDMAADDDDDAESEDDAEEEEAEPEPEKPVVSLVVDFGGFILSDIPNLSQALGTRFKGGYQLDAKRSSTESIKVFPKNAEFEVNLVFKSNGKTNISTLPDNRYVPLGVHYSFSALPEKPMMPRMADDRVGYFLTVKKNFSNDNHGEWYDEYINRWRLEKKNPNRDVSEPVEPIVYYLENTIPEEYRKYMKEGVEIWQKAFEAAGFKNAIIAKDQPTDDPDWDAADVRYSTLRWITSHRASFGAIGPSRVDPRSGEILDADILFEANMIMGFRQSWRRYVGDYAVGAGYGDDFKFPWEVAMEAEAAMFEEAVRNPEKLNTPGLYCSLGHGFVESGGLLQAALAVNGTILPGDPVPEAYVGEALRWVVAHEVGHTLGLRHNFKSSRSVPNAMLHDKSYVKEHGLYGSVMEYPTVNLAANGEKQGYYYSPVVGTYDLWAIEYGYKQINGAKKPADEKKTLDAIASLSSDPLKAYGTDEDSYLPGATDPRTNIFDLGEDPLAWNDERAQYLSTMWSQLDDRTVAEGQSWSQLTGGYLTLMGQYNRSMRNVARYIGAKHQSRAHRGDPGAELPYVPVDPDDQRKALSILTEYCFNDKPFDMPADFYAKISAGNIGHWGSSVSFGGRRDFPFHASVLSVQRGTLGSLMNGFTFAKISDSELGAENPFTMVELFGTLNAAIWSEIGVNGYNVKGTPGAGGAGTGPGNIDSIRRGLQREWTRRLIDVSLNQGSGAMADARSVARMSLVDVNEHIEAKLQGGGLDGYTTAHLMDSQKLIAKALDTGYEAEIMKRPRTGH